MVRAAVESDPQALKWVDNKQCISEIVKQKPEWLQYARKSFQSDKDILAVIRNQGVFGGKFVKTGGEQASTNDIPGMNR